MAFAFFMEMLDGSIIATALPQMAVSFGENPVNLSLGMSAYLLTLAIFIPSSGWMADRFGSKKIFLIAIAVFTFASVLCGFSDSLWTFTAARILQGVGGAMMVPVGRLSVLRSSDKSNLVNLMQMVTVPGLIAPVLGPPIGGLITTVSSWRWIFYLNVPIGILGFALVWIYMTDHRAAEKRDFDTAGFILSGTGLASLLFGLDQLARTNFDPRTTYGLIGFGLVTCVFAFRHLRRAKHPLLDLTLIQIPTFGIASLIAGSAFRIVIGATPFLWPLLFQVGFGMSAFASGALIIACAAGDLSTKAVATRILRRFGFRRTLFVNGLFVALSVLACVTFSAAMPIALVALILFLIGCFRSVEFGAFNALTYMDVTPDRMSSATSLASTLQQLSFGGGIAFGAVALHLGTAVGGTPEAGFTVFAFRFSIVLLALLATYAAFSFLRLAPDAGAEGTVRRRATA